jgi:hypothetical protein
MIVPNQYVKQWTEGARFCYKRGCNCKGCYYQELMSEKCEMKSAVFMLIKKFGAPTDSKYTKTQALIVNAILDGNTTKESLSKTLGKSITNMQAQINVLYRIAREEGCIFHNPRNMFGDFVRWLRNQYLEEEC